MALNRTVNWYVRVSGLETNGGGYDAAVSGAGTNYADQDSPQLSLTDLVSTASTTVTSVAAGFTSQMVGNVLRLASGTGSPTAGYYMIVAYVSATQVTLDRASGTYTAGIAKVGGAHASLKSYADGGTLAAPTLTTPLAPGHTINMRGGGTDNPASADYAYSGGYYTFPDGDTTNGRVSLVGYNGRPCISSDGLLILRWEYVSITNIKVLFTGDTNGGFGFIYSDLSNGITALLSNCYFDAAGFDLVGCFGCTVVNSWFSNSGSSSAGTVAYAAIVADSFGGAIQGNYINGWRGSGIHISNISIGQGIAAAAILNNIIVNCKQHGVAKNTAAQGPLIITGNTIASNSGDGILNTTAADVTNTITTNNIITSNGGYGRNNLVGTTSLNDLRVPIIWNDYNNYGTGGTANTSGAVHNGSLGPHDVQLDPQFTNAGAGDYSIGSNMKSIGFPGVFPAATTTSYVDLGAAQAVASVSSTSAAGIIGDGSTW